MSSELLGSSPEASGADSESSDSEAAAVSVSVSDSATLADLLCENAALFFQWAVLYLPEEYTGLELDSPFLATLKSFSSRLTISTSSLYEYFVLLS